MYHALLLPPEALRDLPALLDDRSPRAEQAAWPCYRSEAFAEDLLGSELPAAPERAISKVVSLLLCATPVCAAVFGGALALFGVVA